MEKEKNNAKQLSELMTALGGTAELTFIFYSNLVRTGFDQSQALDLCKTLIQESIRQANANKQEVF